MVQSDSSKTSDCPPCDDRAEEPLAVLSRLIGAIAATAFAVPFATLCGGSRGHAEAAFARQTAMYLTHVALGLNLTATGRIYRRDRTTAAHACSRIEEQRDDPDTDRLFGEIERVCGDLARYVRDPARVPR